MSWLLTSRLLPQPDSIRTVQDALRVSQSQVLIEALPSVLVLHLDRVRYDTAVGCVMKIQKSIQLAPELEIPLGTFVTFLAAAGVENPS